MHAITWDPPASYARIDQLLRSGDWPAAELEARAAIADNLKEKISYLGPLVGQLAVAEARLGHAEDAVWHWQVALAIAPVPSLSLYGAPLDLLTNTIPRRLDEAPSNLLVRRDGEGGPLTTARKLSGEDAKLPGTLRTFPRGIRVQVIVDREGRVRQPVVVASTFPALTYAVLEAMRQWRFEPALAAGQPVASFYELDIPARQPLERLADFGGSPLAQALEMLKVGRYADAETKLEKTWKGALDDAEQTRGFLAVALALRALAEAGLGRENSAICRFQAAQTMEPRLLGADLSAFGAPGATLMRNPWVAPVLWPRDPGAAFPAAGADQRTKPEVLSRRELVFPDYARRAGLHGEVVIASVLTETGAQRDVVLWQPTAAAGLDAAALDCFCDWRFRPASLRGMPIGAVYSLTVTFDNRPRH